LKSSVIVPETGSRRCHSNARRHGTRVRMYLHTHMAGDESPCSCLVERTSVKFTNFETTCQDLCISYMMWCHKFSETCWMSHIVDHGGPGRSVLPSLVAFDLMCMYSEMCGVTSSHVLNLVCPKCRPAKFTFIVGLHLKD
jgi:hypothetical protein